MIFQKKNLTRYPVLILYFLQLLLNFQYILFILKLAVCLTLSHLLFYTLKFWFRIISLSASFFMKFRQTFLTFEVFRSLKGTRITNFKLFINDLCNLNKHCKYLIWQKTLKISTPHIPLKIACCCSFILKIYSNVVLLSLLNRYSTTVLLTVLNIYSTALLLTVLNI